MFIFRFTATCLLVFGIAQDALAHSTQRNPIRQVSVVEVPTIVASSKRVHYNSKFDLIFNLRDERQDIRLSLEPNHDILHESMHINYIGSDGTLSQSEKLRRHEHRIYRGNAFIRRKGRSEWTKAGWARITLHRDGKEPIFEGAFRIHGDHHHVQTGYNYQRAKHAADPEPNIGKEHEEYMIVWKDSDIIHNDQISTELKRDIDGDNSCNSDALDFNAGFNPLPQDSQNSSSQESLFGRQIDTDSGRTGWDLRNTIGETRGCPTQRQVALVGIATDCTYTASFNSTEAVRSHIIAQVNTASEVYENTLNITLGIQNLTISDGACPSQSSTSAPWNTGCSASIDIGQRLNTFSGWRGDQDDNNAFWTLLTTCGSGSSVGIAWLGTACARGARSAGRDQTVASANVVVRTQSEWQVFAHEAGHIFGAVHDCEQSACSSSGGGVGTSCCPLSENTCDARGQFLMNPSARVDMSTFSPCSIGNICSGMRRLSGQASCLTDNRDVETISDSQCGNGIVEVGEDCDCGTEEECGDNSCCDAQTCTFIGDAVCDASNDACCTDQCQFASSGTTCRASTGDCDPEETCPGDAADCPEDVTLDDGDSCGADGDGLTCASGQCTSRDEQCRSAVSSARFSDNTTACGNDCRIRCLNPSVFDTDNCRDLNQYFIDGTPCGNGGTCQSGDCRRPNRDRMSDFWEENKHILIPVIASVGGVIALVIFYCCFIAPCLRKRKAKKLGNSTDKPVHGIRYM